MMGYTHPKEDIPLQGRDPGLRAHALGEFAPTEVRTWLISLTLQVPRLLSIGWVTDALHEAL